MVKFPIWVNLIKESNILQFNIILKLYIICCFVMHTIIDNKNYDVCMSACIYIYIYVYILHPVLLVESIPYRMSHEWFDLHLRRCWPADRGTALGSWGDNFRATTTVSQRQLQVLSWFDVLFDANYQYYWIYMIIFIYIEYINLFMNNIYIYPIRFIVT